MRLIFDAPYFKLHYLERFFLRIFSYSFYFVLFIAALLAFSSGVDFLFWLSILIFLFLIERLINFRKADYSLVGFIRKYHHLSKKETKDIKINVANYFSPSAVGALEWAYDKALILEGNFYLYLLKFLIGLPQIEKMLMKLDVLKKEFEAKVDYHLSKKVEKKFNPFSQLEEISKLAFKEAIKVKDPYINPWELFLALVKIDDPQLKNIFSLFDILAEDAEKAIIFSRFSKKTFFYFLKGLGSFAHFPYQLRHRTMNRAWTARPTPTLDKYSVDLTSLAKAKKVGFLIGHQKEYDELINILARKINPNALLVGDPGSGKETIVMALAFALIKDEVPKEIFDKRLVAFNLSELIMSSLTDELLLLLDRIIKEILKAKNIVLYLPEIHILFKPISGAKLADVFLPLIKNSDIPIIASTYPKEFKKFIEPVSEFLEIFQTIKVEEVSEKEAEEILTYESLLLEKEYKVFISFKAIKAAVNLAHRYFRNKLLPGSASDLLKESIAFSLSKGENWVKEDDVFEVVKRKLNIPLQKPGEEERKKLLNLEKIIHQELINQEEAVKAVADALRAYRAGFHSKGPIATFLFVGPTGVGKTELAKILTRIQFGKEDKMIRFDMSEYQTKESLYRFIGSPDGKMAGSLTEAIILNPYSLILLDEFEKAHPDILNLFLQVFDDARLTDNFGRVVDFSNTIIIATSNALSNFIKESIEKGKGIGEISEELKRRLTEYFKPELLNRFSKIVAFKVLSKEDIEKIAQLNIEKLKKQLFEESGIDLIFSKEAVLKIAQLGYDPVFGARPLKKAINDYLKSPLAKQILKEDVKRGDKIKIDFSKEKDEFVFEKKYQ